MSGKITRISGPIVYAQGLEDSGLYDVVNVGNKKLIGEIVRQEKGNSTIQVYEDPTGMYVGEEVVCTNKPLSLFLGPGILGNIYDGIQRPLQAMYNESGSFLLPGQRVEPLDLRKIWHFEACAGIQNDCDIYPGMVIGTVKETESVIQSIMIPPLIKGKKLVSFKGTGDYTVNDVIALTELNEEIKLAHYWAVRKPRPYSQKLTVTEPLITGQRVIDVFFPLSKGGTAAIPGGFGTGKTMTQHAIAKWCDADLIVYIGCGERGNEMTDVLTEFPQLIDPRTGRSIMERTVLIANTSNMPVAAREVSLYSGITIAEYYRDMGMTVAVMADSTSRWAEALRELSGRMEEMPAEEGFPAYLPTRLASFYERAGRVNTLNQKEGSVSIIGAVSPPGGDFSEPVTQHTKRFIRCFWALDRELANSRHYPAIGWIESYSEYSDEIKDWWEAKNPLWSKLRQQGLDLLKEEQKLQQIVRLIGPDALPPSQRLVLKVAEMIKNGFLQQNAFDDVDKYCSSDKQIIILQLIMKYYEKADEYLKKGGSLSKVLSIPVCEQIVKIKMQYKNEEIEKIQELEIQLDHQIGELGSLYERN